MQDGTAPPAFPRKPPWLKVRLPSGPTFNEVRRVLATWGLHSVCQEARCPNLAECFQSGTATFLVLGNVCTRNCRYCNIASGRPLPADPTEPKRLAAAARQLGLHAIVITSVSRDDLADGGATHLASCITAIRQAIPGSRIEALVPDFGGQAAALDTLLQAGPHVVNHNLEVVSGLFSALRPQGDYGRSLELLERVHHRGAVSKSGFMVGLGENIHHIEELLVDLRRVGCQRVTIGQYQQPTKDHWPVRRYYTPGEFDALGKTAREMGSNSSRPVPSCGVPTAPFLTGHPLFPFAVLFDIHRRLHYKATSYEHRRIKP